MLKREKKVKEIDITTRCCDICSSGLRSRYQTHGTYCMVCGRDVCSKHKVWDPHEDPSDDYPGVYCTDCILIAKPYLDKIKDLEYEYSEEEEKLRKDMIRDCLEKIKGK